MIPEHFPTVYWAAWDADATFEPGTQLPNASKGKLWAVLVFVFYGDKIVLADIAGRGWCIPSGKIEPGETIDEAAERECWEETGALLRPQRRRLIGCYRLVKRDAAQTVRYCPVFVAEASGLEPIPAGSESQGVFFAAVEEVADLYFHWDALMAAVFSYADERRQALLPEGVSLTDFTAIK